MKKRYFAVSITVVFIILEVLNFTGFCYSSFSYPTEREIIDRWLFKDQVGKLTNEEKLTIAINRGFEDYPSCCRVQSEPSTVEFSERLLNSFFGRHMKQIESHMYDAVENVHRLTFSVINSCGNKTYEHYSTEESADAYHERVRRTKSK